MKSYRVLLLCTSILLTACGPDFVVSDLKSPDGQHHVQVRKCPSPGALGHDSGVVMVSLLEKGKKEGCWEDINSMEQFQLNSETTLELEWVSNTKVCAWSPEFKALHMPYTYSYSEKNPVRFSFYPKTETPPSP